ncbi:MAG: sugar phosphate isomerase/epimerase [Candidatus Bathyarchaeota archaeon]|nr:MAG: sugar phosphate isomerase/epimerase [Candidatus Bathyarchaeota archaeon]
MTVKIGLSMLHCLGKPFSFLCDTLRKTEVSLVELIDDGWHTLNSRRVNKLLEIGEKHDISYTLHAPFAAVNIAAPTRSTRRFMIKRLDKSLRFALDLNCELMVFHSGLHTGISRFYPGEDWKVNIESVREILTLSRKYGVQVVIENCPEPYGFILKSWEQFSEFFDEVDEEIGLALDVGHSNISGQTIAFIEAFRKRIVHIHCHDNDGKHDLHLGVGEGTVNWEAFSDGIKEVGFQGSVIVESYSGLDDGLNVLRKLLT